MKKTKKSVTKRIRFTKRGKLIRRPMGVNHFRTRKSQKLLRKKGKMVGINHPKKSILNY
ncbi:MAG: 50S ribosomal protein L35 [Candidatus Liptonbacteria bacterium]|nr:50S ribosomal protein L35 [Candidatus Liptonbacteria bacterium]